MKKIKEKAMIEMLFIVVTLGDGSILYVNHTAYNTLPKTNIAPENGWLEYYFSLGEPYFQVLC